MIVHASTMGLHRPLWALDRRGGDEEASGLIHDPRVVFPDRCKTIFHRRGMVLRRREMNCRARQPNLQAPAPVLRTPELDVDALGKAEQARRLSDDRVLISSLPHNVMPLNGRAGARAALD
jgi:hypothetical protein